MTKKAFDKIAEGLREALSIARGETKPPKETLVIEYGELKVSITIESRQDGGRQSPHVGLMVEMTHWSE